MMASLDKLVGNLNDFPIISENFPEQSRELLKELLFPEQSRERGIPKRLV